MARGSVFTLNDPGMPKSCEGHRSPMKKMPMPGVESISKREGRSRRETSLMTSHNNLEQKLLTFLIKSATDVEFFTRFHVFHMGATTGESTLSIRKTLKERIERRARGRSLSKKEGRRRPHRLPRFSSNEGIPQREEGSVWGTTRSPNPNSLP